MLWENMTESRLHFFYRICFLLRKNILTIYMPVIITLFLLNTPYELR